MAEEKMRGVILGVGANGRGAGMMHMGAWLKYPALRDVIDFVAVADINPQNLGPFMDSISGKASHEIRAYDLSGQGNLGMMFDDVRPDFVDICTPPFTHRDLALTAADKGAHAILESPIEVTYGKALDICRAFGQAGRACATMYEHRYDDGVVMLRKALEPSASGQNRFGAVEGVRAIVPWKRTREYYDAADWRKSFARNGGGVMTNQGKHLMDMLVHLFGVPETVSAKGTRTVHTYIEGEDTMEARLGYPHGIQADFCCSTARQREEPESLEVRGEGGRCRVVLEGTSSRPKLWKFEPRYYPFDPPQNPIPEDEAAQGGAGDPFAVSRTGHARLMLNFYHHVRHGEPLRATAESAADTTRVFNAVYESIASGGNAVYVGGIVPDWKPDIPRIKEAIGQSV